MPKKPVKSKPKKRVGRPSKFTKEVVDTICNRLANGESLVKICKDDDMPARETVHVWLDDNKNEEFSNRYARARQRQADFMANEILEIVDAKGEDPSDKRVRMDARKWLASKMAPKVYGDKIQNEHTGADGGPIDTKWTVEIVNAKTETEQ